MKTKLTLLLLIGFSSLLNFGCGNNIEPSSDRWNECKKGMAIEEVVEIIGYPDHVSGNGKGILKWYYSAPNTEKKRFAIRFFDGYVEGIYER